MVSGDILVVMTLGESVDTGAGILCQGRSGHCGVLNSIPAPTYSMPGAPPVMTTIDVPRHGPVSPGGRITLDGNPAAEGCVFVEKPLHSFAKGLMEACMCHTGKHQLVRVLTTPRGKNMGWKRQSRHTKATACSGILHGVTGSRALQLKLGGDWEGGPDLLRHGKPVGRGVAREWFWEDPERDTCTEVGLGGVRPLQQVRPEVGG